MSNYRCYAPGILIALWCALSSALSDYDRSRLQGTWRGKLRFTVTHDTAVADLAQYMCLGATVGETDVAFAFEGNEFTYEHKMVNFTTSGFFMLFPRMQTAGRVVSFSDSNLRLKSHSSDDHTRCTRLYKDPQQGANNDVLQYTVTANFRGNAVSSSCPTCTGWGTGCLNPICNVGTGNIMATALLYRNMTIVHQAPRQPKAQCTHSGNPWLKLSPVDCTYVDEVPLDMVVLIVLLVCGLCVMAGFMALLYLYCGDVYRYLCALLCGASSKVSPSDYEIPEVQIYQAKKYRRATTAELAGQLSEEEVAVREEQRMNTKLSQKRRRNTLADATAGTVVHNFAQPGTFMFNRPPDPRDQTVSSTDDSATTKKKKRESQASESKFGGRRKSERRKSVAW